MPFTAIHPAATLPLFRLSRSRGWRSALVLGAMTPDIARAIPGIGREFSHSLPGVLMVSAPMAFALTPIVSRWLVPRLARLPGCEALADPSPSRFPWLLVLLGALLGGGTHLLWDLFTHDGGPTLVHWALLDLKVMDSQAGPVHLRQLAWIAHSLLGGILLAGAFLRMITRSKAGWQALATGTWIRLALAAMAPLGALFYVRAVNGIPIYQDAILFVRSKSPLTFPVLGAAAMVSLLLVLWETRRSRS